MDEASRVGEGREGLVERARVELGHLGDAHGVEADRLGVVKEGRSWIL